MRDDDGGSELQCDERVRTVSVISLDTFLLSVMPAFEELEMI
jgi:hypothetical protein